MKSENQNNANLSLLDKNATTGSKTSRIETMQEAVANLRAELVEFIWGVMRKKELGRHKFNESVYITTDGDGVYTAQQMYLEKDDETGDEFIMFDPDALNEHGEISDDVFAPMSIDMLSIDSLIDICEELVEEGF